MALYLIIGPMHSGKTTALLDEAARVNALGMKTLYINSSVDTRSEDEVSTHNPILKYKSTLHHVTFIKVSRLSDLDVSTFDTILIDEGQFQDDLVESVTRFVEVDKKYVHVAGLSGDFRRKKFGQILDLIPLVDNYNHIMFKTAYCTRCAAEGKQIDACYSKRLTVNVTEQIAVSGSKVIYEPSCAKHYH